MKKILYISRAEFPSEVSHTLSIMRVCQAFADCGYDVSLFGVNNTTNEPNDSLFDFYGLKGGFSLNLVRVGRIFRTRLFQRFGLNGLYLALKVKSTLREIKPSYIYSRLTLLELMLVPKYIPIIYEMHSLGFLGKGRLRKALFQWIVKNKNVARIIVTTDYLANEIRKLMPKVDVKVARLSAEKPIEIDDEKMHQFKQKNLKGKQFKHHVGYTGYLDRVGLRGTEVLLQTASKMEDVAFHIVGGEPEIVDYWKKEAANWNRHYNIFFYGHRKASDIPYFLPAFDVVTAPLQYKPKPRAPIGQGLSPLKISQYLAYGKAIVASDIPAHRELLVDQETAMLVKDDDIEQWVVAIRTLLSSEGLKNRLEENAQKKYFEELTPDTRIARIMEGL